MTAKPAVIIKRQCNFILPFFRHGLGDSYHKLFCDPKLPYADSARKWSESKRRRVPSPKRDSGDSSHEDEDGDADKLSVRRSKRTSQHEERREEEDDDCKMESTSALSELETLARSVRGEQEAKINESLPSVHWFKDTTLEARLHHVVHAVQNNEWPLLTRPTSSEGTDKVRESPGPAHSAHSSQASQPKRRKLHIAIDVETERAKLHALLTTPPPHTTHPQSEFTNLFLLT